MTVGEQPTEAPIDVQTRDWRQRGASLVEYALLVALIALVALAGVQVLGGVVGSTIGESGSSLQRAGE